MIIDSSGRLAMVKAVHSFSDEVRLLARPWYWEKQEKKLSGASAKRKAS